MDVWGYSPDTPLVAPPLPAAEAQVVWCINLAWLLFPEMNDTEWVDGNTMPQLMTHGAGDYILFASHAFLMLSCFTVLESAECS